MNSQVRIIAGKWRGRKIKFTANDALRPTPDRVRETLFNWLGNIGGKSCLDLFAGSGALGLEALSRGAASATFVDESQACCDDITRNITEFKNESPVQILNLAFKAGIQKLSDQQFGLIFLDPPYDTEMLLQACTLIVQHKLLATNGIIYCETANNKAINYPDEMCLEKTKTYSNVTFSLFTINQGNS